MSIDNSNAEKRTGSIEPERLQQSDRGRIRPKHLLLGVDERGAHHIYQTSTETIHIVHEDGSRGRRVVPADKTIDEYMGVVADAHGWRVERYGGPLTDMLVEALD
jgi:hypothetical protein